METQKINSHGLKKFLKHLCIVTKKYYDRELARKNLELQIAKLKKSNNIDEEISMLNRKIDLLLEKEADVAGIGKKKNGLKKNKLNIRKQLDLMSLEKNTLVAENYELRKALDGLKEVEPSTSSIILKAEKGIKRLESSEKKKYRVQMIEELTEKIKMLESNYKHISKQSSAHPARLFKIEESIASYKKELEKLKIIKA